jgi:hypothetical protein
MAEKVLATIGRCIYCGATEPETALEKEHVVPFALGGNHVLLKASCRACAVITMRVEQHICRHMLGPARVQLGYQTRRPKEREKAFKVRFVTDEGTTKVDMPASEAPAMLALPIFALPGILRDARPTRKLNIIPNGFWGRLLNPDGVEALHRASKLGEGQLSFFGFEPWKFALMIAKIGHGAVMARFHDEQFVPFLPNIIRTGQGYIGHFVGSDDKPPPRFDNRTDDIKTGLVINGTGELVFATVQLFADLGGPVYVVIAGMLTDQSGRVDYSGQENVDAVSI